MGSFLGKITVETPKFETLASPSPTNYEIRVYSPSVIAEVTYDPSHLGVDGGFRILAAYIGAIGTPQNAKPEEKIAMTAPVLTTEKIAMTAPVLTTTENITKKQRDPRTMQFVLPSKYKKAEEAPKPVDERVVIREAGERKYGVVRFSGVATEEVVRRRVEELKRWVERDGFRVVGEFLLARYNPPWTLPTFRTNEIMLPLQ